MADDFPYNDEEAAARGTFVTENPVVASVLARSVTRGLTRTLIFPIGTPLRVPGEAPWPSGRSPSYHVTKGREMAGRPECITVL